MNGGLETAIFQKNASLCHKFQIVKKLATIHFFQNLPFIDPFLFWFTCRFFDDTFFGGTDEPL